MLKKMTTIVVSIAIVFLTVAQSKIIYAKKGNIGKIDNIQELNNEIHLNVMQDSSSRVISLNMSNCHSGAIKDGSLYMWGRNYNGQLGNGTTEDQYTPVKVLDNVKSISLSHDYSGAITKDGSLYMWGYNYNGQLGNGTTERRYTPVKVLDNVESISLSDNYSGAITKDGSLYMWGFNLDGQLGNGTTERRYTPVKVLDNVESISLSDNYSGAITKDGNLYMWGSNLLGQLGDGTTHDRHTPVKVLNNAKSVSLEFGRSGAVTKDGSLYMWGYNLDGVLGDGTTEDQYTPVKVLDNVESISLSNNYSGAITKDESLYMWGDNWHGQLGDGTTERRYTPVKVLDNVKFISLDKNYSGAITTDGSLYMWGENWNGALGDGTIEMRLYPVKIDLLSNPDDTQSETVLKKVSQKITYKSSAIKKSKQGKQVIYGSSFSLNAKTSGTGKLTYKSGNKKILSVNSKGEVKVNGYGPTYIKIKASGGNGYKAAILGIKLTAVPRQGKITRAEWQKTGVYFNWKSEKTVDGYDYAIAYNKKFVGQGRKKTTKTGVVLTKYKTNAKKMYIRVRTYKKVGKKTYYGSWSEPKLLKLKKSKRAK